jgi:preprotein translocase subunit SecE
MLSSPKADKIEIRKLDKTSGESIDFPASDPGRVRGNFVTGTGTLTKAVELFEIASADVQTISRQDEIYQSVKTRDGKSYDWVKKIVERGDKSVLYVAKAISNRATSFFEVSLSEVEKVWAKRLNPVIKALLIVYLVVAIISGIMLATGEGMVGDVPIY